MELLPLERHANVRSGPWYTREPCSRYQWGRKALVPISRRRIRKNCVDVQVPRELWVRAGPTFLPRLSGKGMFFFILYNISRYLHVLDNCRLGATDFSSTTTMKLLYLAKRLWTSSTVPVSAHLHFRINWIITYPPGLLESPKKTHRQKNRSSKSSISSISRSMISSPAPDSFRHVAHVGVNSNGVFEATKSLDASWKEMLTQLQGHGVSEAVVMKHHDFVDGFWRGVEAIQGNESSKTDRFDGKSAIFQICRVVLDFPDTGYSSDLTRKMTSRSGIWKLTSI